MSLRDDEHEPEPTAEEIAAAEALRAALEDPGAAIATASEDADFARALAIAHSGSSPSHVLDAAENAAILARAYENAASRAPQTSPVQHAPIVSLTARRKRANPFAVASMTALALAAAIALFVGRGAPDAPSASSSSLTPGLTNLTTARSTEPLFTGRAGLQAANAFSGSSRIDRIARVRDQEFLDARIDAWQLGEARGR